MLLILNHIATVSSRWRAQNLLESRTFTTRYVSPCRSDTSNVMALNSLESPRPYPQREGMEQENES